MTGNQALEAVRRPGGRLVTEDVAAAIVRFVAGGAEIANAEVEPSLLSLICRELNDKRIAEGRAEISLDLLAGSHATILAEFYERALADQPAALRRVIEDELLTESGYRENVAEERIVSLFAAAGAGRITGSAFAPVDLPARAVVCIPAAAPPFTVENLGGLDLIRITPNWPAAASHPAGSGPAK